MENPEKKFESRHFDNRLVAYVDPLGNFTVKDWRSGELWPTWKIVREWEEVKEPVTL